MSDERPTFGSLFAGIGGIDLGLERAGWTGRWQVEWDAYCQRVLAKHWPDIPRYGDIATVDWSGVERVDLLAGGFPCQPISSAGLQKAQGDERWLWPEFHRAIRALRPELVLVENVTNLLAVNDGSAFGDVLGDLAASGYDAEWDCIPASAVGALHERDRVWIVAHADRHGRHAAGRRQVGPEGSAFGPALSLGEHRGDRPPGAVRGAGTQVAHADRGGLEGVGITEPRGVEGTSGRESHGRRSIRELHDSPLADTHGGRREQRHEELGRVPVPDASRPPVADSASLGASGPREHGQPLDPTPGRDGQAGQLGDGGWWRTEPNVGRVAHGVPSRVDRLRSLGNAVVPQVVEVIGRRLMDIIEAERAA